MPDLSADIAAQAVEPITVSADGQSATGRGIGELIQADQYGEMKAARKRRRFGMVISKMIPQGAAPDTGGSADFNRPGV